MRFRCENCGAQYAIADEKLGKKGVRVRCKKCSEIITVLPPESQESAQGEDLVAVPTDPNADLGHDHQAEAGERENTEVDQAPGQAADALEDSGAGGDGFDLGADDELKSALDNILGDDDGLGDDLGDEEDDEEDDPDLDRQSTRVFTVEEMQQVQAEREQAVREDDEVGGPADSASGEAASAADESPAVSDEDRERVEWYAAVDDQQVGPMSLNEFAERWRSGEFDSETLVWKTGFDDWRSVFELAEFSFLAEEEEPAGDDWASQKAEPEDDWSQGVGQGLDEDDEASDGDEGLGGFGGFDDEDEDQDGSGDYYDDEAASSAASATAFAADVEWQPSALSSLNSLAEEELAELAPEDPEPEEEELPFDSDEGLPAADAEGLGGEEMEDGDSSLIAQIAAEEEAAAKRAEVERAEKEQQAEELRRKEEESALAAQEAAAREKLEEQRERAAPPEEKYIPPRSSLPKWAIGLMVGGGLMMLALVGTLGYLLAKGDEPIEPNGTQAIQPAGPVKPAGPDTPPSGPAPTNPTGPTADKPAADQAVADGAPTKPGEQPANPEMAKAGTEPKPPPADKPQPVARPADVKKPKPKPDRSPRKKRRKRKVDRKPDRVAVAPKVPDPVEDKPKARDEKPPRRKPKGGILDFEDPDDRAFAAETGVKARPPAPKPEKKVLPPLKNADILAVMKGHLAEFKACNRKQKQVDSSVRGKMVINFAIANNGRVKSASIAKSTGQFKGTYVAGCITGVIKRLKFPEFGGPVKKVPFPFTVN